MKRLRKAIRVLGIAITTASLLSSVSAYGAGESSGTKTVVEAKGGNDVGANLPLLTPEEVEKLNAKKEEESIIKRRTGAYLPEVESGKSLVIKKVPIKLEQEHVYFSVPDKVDEYGVVFGTSLNPKKSASSAVKTVAVATTQPLKTSVSEKPSKYYYKAVCEPVRDYKVTLYPVPAELKCLITAKGKTGVGIVKGQFVPDLKTYSLRLVPSELPLCPKPESIEVLNGERDSYNVATEVNRRVIQNVLLLALRDTGVQTSGYLQEAFKQAGTKITYDEGGNVQSVEVGEKISKVPRYAAYSFGANLLKAISEFISSKGGLPTLFVVKKNSRIYVEGYCLDENNPAVTATR